MTSPSWLLDWSYLGCLSLIWVMRKPSWLGESHKVKLPDVGSRIEPRVVDYFGQLGHLGSRYSSLIEALQYGRPLILLPFLYDQGLIARFRDKKIGIEVPRNEEDGSFTRKSLAESLNLVVGDEEGKTYKDRAKEHGEVFTHKNLHDRYMDKCLEYLENNRLKEHDKRRKDD
ncbi:hypothetical protein ACE6H2_020976 [Prunus campanulata]